MTYYVIMDLIMLVIGGYCLYCWYLMVFKRELEKIQVFLPTTTPVEKCKKKDAFIKGFSPALLIFSLAFFLIGLVFSLNDLLAMFPVSSTVRVYTIPLVAVFVAMVIYTRRMAKKFW